jgi:hypothetical protein
MNATAIVSLSVALVAAVITPLQAEELTSGLQVGERVRNFNVETRGGDAFHFGQRLSYM